MMVLLCWSGRGSEREGGRGGSGGGEREEMRKREREFGEGGSRESERARENAKKTREKYLKVSGNVWKWENGERGKVD